MATHRGHIIVPAVVLPDAGMGPAQGPDITLPDTGDKWEDITGTPSALYIDPPPNSLIVYVEASEATFLALGDDVLWFEEIPPEPGV